MIKCAISFVIFRKTKVRMEYSHPKNAAKDLNCGREFLDLDMSQLQVELDGGVEVLFAFLRVVGQFQVLL